MYTSTVNRLTLKQHITYREKERILQTILLLKLLLTEKQQHKEFWI